MKIKDGMVKDVVTIEPSASLVDAATKMREANIGMLPITERGMLRAILTDRDVVVRAVSRNADLTTTRVTDCATETPVSARPDWDVEKALEVMARQQVGRLPVVDEDGRLVGIVTLSSLVLRGEKPSGALEAASRVSERAAKGGVGKSRKPSGRTAGRSAPKGKAKGRRTA